MNKSSSMMTSGGDVSWTLLDSCCISTNTDRKQIPTPLGEFHPFSPAQALFSMDRVLEQVAQVVLEHMVLEQVVLEQVAVGHGREAVDVSEVDSPALEEAVLL